MDFMLTQEQKLIKDAAREFLEKECPSELIRVMGQDDKGYPPQLWQKMAELDWFGLFPEEYGGSGEDEMGLIVLLEEMGRCLAPVPFLPTIILGGFSILFGGTEEQKMEYLPKISNGELILTMAIMETNICYDASEIHVKAVKEGEHFLINGTKLFVPYAQTADHIICVTRTEENDHNEDGITLFMIEGKNPGISCVELKTMACEKVYEVVFNDTLVSEKNILGRYSQGWTTLKRILEKATIAQCAFMVGGAEKVLEMTLDHARTRKQFGHPIGSYQAIQHKCANMKIWLDGARFATYEAAWKIEKGLPCTLEVSVAKGWVNQAYNNICAEGHQIFGGSGLIKDYDMYLYSTKAKEAEFFFGDTEYHREIVAQSLDL